MEPPAGLHRWLHRACGDRGATDSVLVLLVATRTGMAQGGWAPDKRVEQIYKYVKGNKSNSLTVRVRNSELGLEVCVCVCFT